MRRLFTKRWVLIAAGFLAISCLALLVVCWRFRIWSYSDYELYQEVRRYPIGEDLWFGRIRAGDDLEAFTAAYPPHRTVRYGRFTEMEYFEVWPTPPGSIQMHSLKVIAKDSRLAFSGAFHGTRGRWFFKMNSDVEEEFDRARSQRDRGKGP